MRTRLEWEDPDVVTEWDKQQCKVLIKRSWLAITKAIWLLWLLVLPIAYHWGPRLYEPEEFPRWFRGIFLVGLLSPSFFVAFPIVIPLLPTLFFKNKHRYELNEKGVFGHSMTQSPRIGWRRISDYRFVDHSEVPGIRVLEFNIKGANHWYQFSLNPQQVEENEIRSVFDNHLKVLPAEE